MIILSADQVKYVTNLQRHAENNVKKRKIAMDPTRHVTKVEAFVLTVRLDFKKANLRFTFYYQECNNDAECRKGEACDRFTHTCGKSCKEKLDCKDYRHNQTCDTNRGFCVDGRIFFSHFYD